jgi:hypothetical protein
MIGGMIATGINGGFIWFYNPTKCEKHGKMIKNISKM